MTGISHDWARPQQTVVTGRFLVAEERSRRVLDALLSDDRAYAAYALVHLEPELLIDARFHVARAVDDASRRPGVVLHAGGALGRTMFVAGDPEAVRAILALHPGPGRAYLVTAAPEHAAVLEETYRFSARQGMQRMSVSVDRFTPAPGAPPAGVTLRRLRAQDVGALNSLYAAGDGPTGFRGADIDEAIYVGAYDGGRMVAVAGTHLVAPHASVAMVGNVLTHPAHRGRGLATQVTSRVTEALFDYGCALVALTVDPENTPAVHAYGRLGYRAGTPVIEARIQRRDWLGFGSFIRRWQARRAHAGQQHADDRDEGASA